MATGQSRKTQDGSLVFTSCNTSTSSDQDDSLTFTCFPREYRLMATGQSRKNPGCRLHGYGEVSEQFRKVVAGAILQRTCAHNCHSKFCPLLWSVCVYTLLEQGMVNCACSYKNMQGDGEDVWGSIQRSSSYSPRISPGTLGDVPATCSFFDIASRLSSNLASRFPIS